MIHRSSLSASAFGFLFATLHTSVPHIQTATFPYRPSGFIDASNFVACVLLYSLRVFLLALDYVILHTDILFQSKEKKPQQG